MNKQEFLNGRIAMINADCLEAMDELINQNVIIDSIICDPPYGTTACKWDTVIPFNKMWERLNKLIKPNGAIVLFGSEPFSSTLRMSNIKNYRYDWIWHKNMGGGFVTAKKLPMKRHEIISVFYNKLPTYNPQFEEYSDSVKDRFKNNPRVNVDKGIKNGYKNKIQNIKRAECEVNLIRGKYPQSVKFFPAPPNANGARFHPTQKPVALIEYLIKTYTNENELVLDFTAGSFTAAIACIKTNRRFIGCELDAKYFDMACKRIESELIQENLF
jgi:DNA modification methylase